MAGLGVEDVLTSSRDDIWDVAGSSLSDILASCDDISLRRLTEFLLPRLAEAMADTSVSIAAMLTQQDLITQPEYQKIECLVEKSQKKEAARQLLDVVLRKPDARAGRAMWAELSNFQSNVESCKLRALLSEISAKGASLLHEATRKVLDIRKVPDDLQDCHLRHKETLRERNRTLMVNTISGREKVRAFLLEDQYTDLVVISSLREMRVVEHELLARGRDHETWRQKAISKELETIQHHQIFCSSFGTESRSTSVAISGVAGIGKTTLLQKIVYDWASGKIYDEFHFIFHFKFRDLNYYRETNLRILILDSYPYLSEHLDKILADPYSLLFIFDGLDEFRSSITFSKSTGGKPGASVCPDPNSFCPIADIVRYLVQGDMLDSSSVLITTRPTVLKSLKKSVIHLHAEILGFNAEQRKKYFLNFFEDEKMGEEAFKYVEQNDILYTMCYNPSYCWIICSSLETTFREGSGAVHPHPRTITELFSSYIYNILQNHPRESGHSKDVLRNLGNMAYEGVSSRIIVFNKSHLESQHLEPSQFLSGFLMEILQMETCLQNEAYTFFHLTVQEFIAALTKFIHTPPEQVTTLLDRDSDIKDGRYEIFLRFFAGLSCPRYRKLAPFFGEMPHDTTCHVIDWVKKKLERKTRNKRKRLNAFHCLYECQNTGLTQAIVSKIKQINLSKMTLSPVDCFVLAWAFRSCDSIETLNLQSCIISQEGLSKLGPVLHKCTELWLESVTLGDMGAVLLSRALNTPECRIQKLVLANNKLTDACAKDLADALQINQHLKHLLLSRNCFTSTSVVSFNRILLCCGSLKEYRIGSNPLGDLGVTMMKMALMHKDCRLQRLSLFDTGLTDGGAEELCSALSTSTYMTQLDLSRNSFTAKSTRSFVHLIEASQSLESLDLSKNRLGDAGALQLAEGLRSPECKLRKLGLRDNNLTESGTQVFCSTLSTNLSLRRLDLCGNAFSDFSVPHLSNMIRSCYRLRDILLFGNTKMSSEGRKVLQGLNTELKSSRPKLRVML
ncbi:NACHT, LRR and PYD domains-containing protein 3-like isoform X1 [Pleurodeles waltl]|uniref:NACHT, LRR and PYD domains-containing protein 3-like isoform X1 n=2 Tax=Pleurodeles waltl TaxID=8319 RepID=UPI0037098E3B